MSTRYYDRYTYAPTVSQRYDAEDLAKAAAAGDLEEVQKIVSGDVDINKRVRTYRGGNDRWNQSDVTALMIASERGHFPIVEWLLKNGADPNIRNFHHYTALDIAARNGQAAIIRLLRYHGATDVGGRALWEATKNKDGWVDVVEALIETGSDVNAEWHGTTPLMNAVDIGSIDVIDRLIAAGANVKHIDGVTGENILMRALLQGYDKPGLLAIVDRLIVAGVDLKHENKLGETALLEAIYTRNYDVLERLLQVASDTINIPSNDGTTPLRRAVDYLWPEAVRLLLDFGADPLIRDAQGRTVLEQARKIGNTEILQMLEEPQVKNCCCYSHLPRNMNQFMRISSLQKWRF